MQTQISVNEKELEHKNEKLKKDLKKVKTELKELIEKESDSQDKIVTLNSKNEK